jgi:hypothetical protein
MLINYYLICSKFDYLLFSSLLLSSESFNKFYWYSGTLITLLKINCFDLTFD